MPSIGYLMRHSSEKLKEDFCCTQDEKKLATHDCQVTFWPHQKASWPFDLEKSTEEKLFSVSSIFRSCWLINYNCKDGHLINHKNNICTRLRMQKYLKLTLAKRYIAKEFKKGESGLLLTTTLTLLGGDHIDSQVWRWIIVPSNLAPLSSVICEHYDYRVIHNAIRQLTLT